MSRYIEVEKLIEAILDMRKKYATQEVAEDHKGLRAVLGGQCLVLTKLIDVVDSLQQEQPDNEDIDKVAQELYEHLYELKRRNNVPTNLYDKQEIINLWKAGIEYAYNHPNQEQQMPNSTRLIAEWEKEKEVLEQKDFRGDPWRLAYNAFLDGFVKGLGYEGTK